MTTAAFGLLTIALAALLYSARVSLTEPGGPPLKAVSVLVFGVPAVLSALAGGVAAAITFANASSRTTTFASVAMPIVATLALVVGASLPVGYSLMSAVNRNDLAGVERSLRFGVNVDTRSTITWHNFPGEWALTAAAREGNAEIVRLLIAHGATVNTNDTKAPLSAAADAGHLEVVRILLKAGADPSFVDQDGQSALRRAQLKGHGDIAERLRSACAISEVIPAGSDLP